MRRPGSGRGNGSGSMRYKMGDNTEQTGPYIASDGVIALRPLTLEDSQLIVDWRNNPRVRSRYVNREPFTLEGQERYYHSRVATGEVVQFVVCESAGGRPIGCSVLDDIHPRYAEFGSWIGEDDAIGKGYNAHIVRLTCRWAFRELGVDDIVCRIFTDNPASWRGCERGGFRIVGILPQVECSDGTKKDMYFLRMQEKDLG